MASERNGLEDRMAERPGKVLLVDDHPELRRLFRRGLLRQGHEVVEAWNGREAIELARKQSFDAVISDVRMPDIDGLELLEGLLLLDPDLAVVLVSGSSDPEVEQTAQRLGAFAYLLKPMELEALTDATTQAIALSRRRAEARVEIEPYGSVQRLRVSVPLPLVAGSTGRR
jgi:DNA-binding NtrC family response regulator